MKNSDISISKHILKYGLFLGLTLVIINGVLYYTDNLIEKDFIFSIFITGIIITGIVIGITSFKKNNQGYLSLKQAFKIGIGVSVISALISIIWFILLFKVIDPDFVNQIEANYLKKLAQQSSEFTQAQIDRRKDMAVKSTSPLAILIIFFERLFYGIVTSLVTGLIVKKKREPVLD